MAVGLTAIAVNAGSATNTIKDYNEAMEQAKDSSKEVAANGEVEIASVQLKADTYEKLRKQYEETGIGEGNLKAAAEELQKVLPSGIQLIDAQTGSYIALGNSIDTVIAKMRAQILLNSQKPAYETAIKQSDKLKSDLDKQQKIYDDKAKDLKKNYLQYDTTGATEAEIDKVVASSLSYEQDKIDVLKKAVTDNNNVINSFENQYENFLGTGTLTGSTSPFAYMDQDARKGLKATADTVNQGTTEVSATFKAFYDNLKQQKAAHIIDDKEYNSQLLKNLTTNNYDKGSR